MGLQGAQVVVDLLARERHPLGQRRRRPGLGERGEEPRPDGVERDDGGTRVLDHLDVEHASREALTNNIVKAGRSERTRHPARAGAQSPKWTLPFERARAWARSTKSSRLIAPRNRRVTSRSRAVSERRSSRPCLASSPNSTVAAIW